MSRSNCQSNCDCGDCRTRHQKFTLQVTSGEKVIEEIRTISGIPGDGTRIDLMSVRMALALGCRIKPCKIEHYGIGSDGKPLEIVGLSRLKIRRPGHFGILPHWITISVLVVHSELIGNKDFEMSWPTQRQLRLPNSKLIDHQIRKRKAC